MLQDIFYKAGLLPYVNFASFFHHSIPAMRIELQTLADVSLERDTREFDSGAERGPSNLDGDVIALARSGKKQILKVGNDCDCYLLCG